MRKPVPISTDKDPTSEASSASNPSISSTVVKNSLSHLEDITFPEREKKSFSLCKTFGIDLGNEKDDSGELVFGENNSIKKRDRKLTGYAHPTPHTPKIDPHYIFPKKETCAFLMGMHSEPKDPMLLVGGTGCGKSSIITQIAARLNYNLFQISFDAQLDRSHLLGEPVVRGGEIFYQYGIIPTAFRMPGTIILLDEWDAQNEDVSYVMQRALERTDRKIFLLDTMDLIEMHPDNILCASSNTTGQGDDSGLYGHGTRIQSYAQLNRFSLTIKMDYPTSEMENNLLMSMHPDLERVERELFIAAIGKLREGFTNGEISVPVTTRDLCSWAEKYLMLYDVLEAATFCFLNRMNDHDALTAKGIIQRLAGF